MAKAKNETMTMSDFIKQMPLGPGMSPLMGPSAQHFWEAQENLLNEAETFSKHWFERRHAATQAALSVAKDISGNGNGNPGAAVMALSEWQTHSMQRMLEDIREWAALCSRCAAQVAAHETQVVGEAIDTVAEKTGQKL